MNPYGSHQGPLCIALGLTKGPILELGTGRYSTQLLHDHCAGTSRSLVSCEESARWYVALGPLMPEPFHDAFHITNWDAFLERMEPYRWGVVLVDSETPETVRENGGYVWRAKLADFFLKRSDIVVVHDTEDPSTHGEWTKAKYLWTFKPKGLPWTSMVSESLDFLSLMGLKKIGD